ncbi:MAG: deoxynucleoside kinase, partial [Bacillota bacterium]|nr:deoxynucleoside kinase [Bacillota bacterium]
YEQIVEREYWENLNKEYEDYFSEYNLSPLLIIDAAKYDIVENKEDRAKVLQIIQEKIAEIDKDK